MVSLMGVLLDCSPAILNTGMNTKDWLVVVVPAFVSIIGFLVTYLGLKSSFKDEIRKQKSNIALDKMSTVPFETLDLYETIMSPVRLEKQIEAIENKGQQSKTDRVEIQKIKGQISDAENSFSNKTIRLYNTIYAYGSVEAIKIVSSMQKMNYRIKADAPVEERYIIMAHMILLASQVKKDVTGVIVNPKQWFEMKITDYEEKRESFDLFVNKVVDDLELDENFKILS